jgi:hypothetical protein
MMPSDEARLDLILRTRLELLEQAVDEVSKIIEAMRDQRERLGKVEECLRPGGQLSSSEKKIRTTLGDAATRLDTVLDEDSAGLGNVDRGLLNEAQQFLLDAKPSLSQLSTDRSRAYESFQGIRRWSIAGLPDQELNEAAQDYRRLLADIRRSAEPWQRYAAQLRGRGQELFTLYLELLGGMAVRGLGLDAAALVGDVQMLVRHLMQPLGSAARKAPQPRSPHVLMGTRHRPLGYPEWSLWALPLVGRTAGEYLIREGTFETAVPEQLRVLCADLYALHALGPSYAPAALFLELDPGEAPTGVLPDSIRARVLLKKLTQLGDGSVRKSLEWIAKQLAEPWSRARLAVRGRNTSLDQSEREVLEEFFIELRDGFKEIAYETRWLSEAEHLGRKLAEGGEGLDNLAPSPRDLITAIWLARLENPTRARLIHSRAKIVAQRIPIGNQPL